MSPESTLSSGLSSGGQETGMCAAFVDALHVSGASISVFGTSGQQSTIGVSDLLAEHLDSLQFSLGEGPRWQAVRTGNPVLCSDLSNAAPQLWPTFCREARALGVAAVFAFPMRLGAATVGVVDLHTTTKRVLDPHQVSLASSMANRFAVSAVRMATIAANDHGREGHGSAPAMRREVHQATGMIQVQLDTTTTEAFARLRGYAFSLGVPVETVAGDVVAGRVDFSTLPE